jgi:hypothetical protein
MDASGIEVTTDHPDDRDLVHAAKNGELDAFETLVKRRRGLVDAGWRVRVQRMKRM